MTGSRPWFHLIPLSWRHWFLQYQKRHAAVDLKDYSAARWFICSSDFHQAIAVRNETHIYPRCFMQALMKPHWEAIGNPGDESRSQCSHLEDQFQDQYGSPGSWCGDGRRRGSAVSRVPVLVASTMSFHAHVLHILLHHNTSHHFTWVHQILRFSSPSEMCSHWMPPCRCWQVWSSAFACWTTLLELQIFTCWCWIRTWMLQAHPVFESHWLHLGVALVALVTLLWDSQILAQLERLTFCSLNGRLSSVFRVWTHRLRLAPQMAAGCFSRRWSKLAANQLC